MFPRVLGRDKPVRVGANQRGSRGSAPKEDRVDPVPEKEAWRIIMRLQCSHESSVKRDWMSVEEKLPVQV